MATVNELLGYGGSAALGTGSNSDIPVAPQKELNAVEDAGRTATLLNAQRNMQLFRQRVADRDKLLEALQAGLVKAGNILERDRPMFNSAVDKQTQAFKKWGGNPNDIDGALAYKKATQEAQDVVTKAQARYLTDVGERDLISKETSTEKRGRIQKNLDDYYKKGFYADFVPHQELLDFNHELLNKSTLRDSLISNTPLGSGGTKTTSRSIVGKDGKLEITTTVPGKHYDFEKILNNATDDFLHDEKVRENQNMWRSYVENADPREAKKIVDYTNEKIDQYNNERGLRPGDKGYVEGITDDKAILGPDGKLHINMPTSEFAAKTALASINGGYVESDKSEFNKDIATYKQNEAELAEKIRHNKATEGIDWSKYNLDKDKFSEGVKGKEEAKSAAMIYADNLLNDMIANGTKAANGSYILTPDQIRKLTGEQLKYLGRELPAQKDLLGNTTQVGGLQPLELKDDEVLQINPDGTVLVMGGAKLNRAGNQYSGKFDNQRSTSIFNVARNVLNEENQKAGSQERNAYINIDTRNRDGKIQIDVSGGGTTKSGSTTKKDNLSGEEKDWKREGKYYRYKDGTLYDDAGNVIKEK
jgi:hypothetical protein